MTPLAKEIAAEELSQEKCVLAVMWLKCYTSLVRHPRSTLGGVLRSATRLLEHLSTSPPLSVPTAFAM